MKQQKNTKITLQYLVDNKKPIYIRHNALKANLLLLLEMKDRQGMSQPVQIPPTEMPINLTERFSYATIEASEQLRTLLYKEVVVLMDPADAEEFIANNLDEVQAVGISSYSDSAAPNAARSGLERLKEEVEYGTLVATQDLGQDLSAEDALTPKVQTIIASFESGETTAKDTLAALKKAKHIMSAVDRNYILAKCKKEKQIREYIENLSAEQQ